MSAGGKVGEGGSSGLCGHARTSARATPADDAGSAVWCDAKRQRSTSTCLRMLMQ